MSVPLSHFVPAYPSPSPCPQVHSLCLHLYSWRMLSWYLYITSSLHLDPHSPLFLFFICSFVHLFIYLEPAFSKVCIARQLKSWRSNEEQQGWPLLRAGDQHLSLGSASQRWKVMLGTTLYSFPLSFWTSRTQTQIYRNLWFMIPSCHLSGQGPLWGFIHLFCLFIFKHLCPWPNTRSRTLSLPNMPLDVLSPSGPPDSPHLRELHSRIFTSSSHFPPQDGSFSSLRSGSSREGAPELTSQLLKL